MKARRRRRSGLIRRRWPAKRSLRMMIVATKSKRGWVAVSAKSSPVMWDRQRLLNPLIFFRTELTRDHASHPCVKLEHTAVLYKRIFIFMDRRWSAHVMLREHILYDYEAMFHICCLISITLDSAAKVFKRVHIFKPLPFDDHMGESIFHLLPFVVLHLLVYQGAFL